ncbi:transporter substrate-binding domain-containing protein [Christiangramia sp. LLG6405-1]|uniref:transporter substrate-binding domain-containing protein n=1 Tax=Christiangramia sp. LLG6405-1 TaxID=3160832 RepID=UPI003868912E
MMSYSRFTILFVCFIFFWSNSLIAQDSLSSENNKVVIGISETAPFVEKHNGKFRGLSVASWKMVNEELQLDYEFKEYKDLGSLLDGIEAGEVDFSINPVTVTDNRMHRMEFSQPYFISHTSVAKRSESQTLRHLKNLFSWEFFSIIGLLLLVIFIFGFLVWVFERKQNKEEFGGNLRGILQGFWWSAVTMTTVGYGDKSPRTLGGRIIGLIWMFMAVIIISSFTAGIASSLTVKGINEEISSIQDLDRFEVTTVLSSSSQELLDLYNIETELVNNGMEALDKLNKEETFLVVYDEPILRYHIEQMNLENELEIIEQSLKKDYYSYAFPKNSEYRDMIDPVLVRILKSMEWASIVKEYN